MHEDWKGNEIAFEDLPPVARACFELLHANDDHAAVAWFEKLGNGIFEGDFACPRFPAPCPVFRFRRNDRVAYIWKHEDLWAVNRWHRLRERVAKKIEHTATFRDALDLLARKTSWWGRLWN
jgi:hypothetical protein